MDAEVSTLNNGPAPAHVRGTAGTRRRGARTTVTGLGGRTARRPPVGRTGDQWADSPGPASGGRLVPSGLWNGLDEVEGEVLLVEGVEQDRAPSLLSHHGELARHPVEDI